MLVLSKSDVKKAVTMEQAIAAMETAFAAYSRGEAIVPVRTQLDVPRHEGTALFMPGYLAAGDSEGLAIKIVSVYSRNQQKGMPTIFGVVVTNDPTTGRPKALLEAGYLTALRTGAAGGAAARHLAREDASILAVIGAGTQARTQVAAVRAVRPIQEIRLFDINQDSARAFAQELAGDQGATVTLRVTASPEEAVRGGDVIVTATTAREPVINGEWLSPGTHITAVGAFTPEMREIDVNALQRANKIVVDSREAAMEEAGDLIIPIEEGLLSVNDIYGELGEITGGTKPGRENPDEITIFKSVGLAVQDVAIADLITTQALKLGLGTEVSLE